ncbi:MAG: LysM peptidoglycan-binding domain-containing protein, partial [Plesiomonas shigelloides]
MDSSMAIGQNVSRHILRDLGRVTELHKSEPEMASLAVLKSPDIPSILIETGFISNPAEEKLLKNGAHQEKLAKAIHSGVMRYFEANPPADTYLANRGKSQPSAGVGKHKVARGESLTRIATQYGVSVHSLRQANNLKSDMVQVGQHLVIPRG